MKPLILSCLMLAIAGITAGSVSSPKRDKASYQQYLDSLWQANPDYYLDVEMETDTFNAYHYAL